jgi:hypothetical protein
MRFERQGHLNRESQPDKASLGHEFVAVTQVGRLHFAVMTFLEGAYGRFIGVDFPNEQAQRLLFFLASASRQREGQGPEK